MRRRDFNKSALLLGVGVQGVFGRQGARAADARGEFYDEPPKRLPVRHFDVVVAGAGTGGVIAALAAARQGAKTMVIESKGYPGGTAVEGGTAIHSFYNLWKPFEGCQKRKVVRGIPEQLIDRLTAIGGATGYPEMEVHYDYDSVCTAIDTELYKLTAFEMLDEAGVFVAVNTLLTGAIVDGVRVRGVITESRSGREAIMAKAFVDCTGYGDLCAHAGASFTEPNDYAVANSLGLANASIDDYYNYIKSNGNVTELCKGPRSGEADKVIRVSGGGPGVKVGMITTTCHDNYLMFLKCNEKMPVSPTNRDEVAKTELILRKQMAAVAANFRKNVPGCEKAFMARTSPSLCIRRARLIACDYDITHEDVVQARHFNDDVFTYGFHDSAPRLTVGKGQTYGTPYRALCVAGIENLYATGMMITKDHRAHMSTRNTVSCMGHGQAAGTAAALCAAKGLGSRDLKYADLRAALEKANVYFEA